MENLDSLPFQILEELGKGGMGTVYLALQPTLGREVALKVIHPGISQNEEYILRFRREMKFAARLSHPNLVRVFDGGMHNGVLFIAMERLHGDNLQLVIDRASPLEWTVALSIGVQMAEALAYLHGEGILHRDIKPANILISRDGCVKMVDFGVAHAESATPITAPGTLIGTLTYLSPELVLGQPATVSSDLWAVGCVLYHMLTGRKHLDPSGKNVSQWIARVINDPIRPPNQYVPALPLEVSRVVLQLLSKDPANRPHSASDLVSTLKEILSSLTGSETSTASISMRILLSGSVRNRLVSEQLPPIGNTDQTTLVPLTATTPGKELETRPLAFSPRRRRAAVHVIAWGLVVIVGSVLFRSQEARNVRVPAVTSSSTQQLEKISAELRLLADSPAWAGVEFLLTKVSSDPLQQQTFERQRGLIFRMVVATAADMIRCGENVLGGVSSLQQEAELFHRISWFCGLMYHRIDGSIFNALREAIHRWDRDRHSWVTSAMMSKLSMLRDDRDGHHGAVKEALRLLEGRTVPRKPYEVRELRVAWMDLQLMLYYSSPGWKKSKPPNGASRVLVAARKQLAGQGDVSGTFWPSWESFVYTALNQPQTPAQDFLKREFYSAGFRNWNRYNPDQLPLSGSLDDVFALWVSRLPPRQLESMRRSATDSLENLVQCGHLVMAREVPLRWKVRFQGYARGVLWTVRVLLIGGQPKAVDRQIREWAETQNQNWLAKYLAGMWALSSRDWTAWRYNTEAAASLFASDHPASPPLEPVGAAEAWLLLQSDRIHTAHHFKEWSKLRHIVDKVRGSPIPASIEQAQPGLLQAVRSEELERYLK